jgi:hypothetical protein
MIRSILLSTAAAAVLAATALAQTTDATTATYTTTQASVPFGLAATETAQVNLINTASNSSSGTIASCTGTVAFYNSSNTQVGSSTPFTIASEHIASASLAGSAPRAEIRAVVTFTTTSSVPCQLDSSIETYDTSTGVTHLFLPQSNVAGPAPGPQHP